MWDGGTTVAEVHPIERLRYVARAGPADARVLVRETASALAGLGDEPAGLVTACRRILERQPASGPLWWLAARVLTAGDPLGEAWRAAEELDDDPTPRHLADALPDGATLTVIGWPEQIADALPRRGDVEVLVVDSLGEGTGLVRRLVSSDVDAVEVPEVGVGAAAVASDVVLVEAVAMGGGAVVATVGSYAAAAVGRHAGAEVWVVAGRGRALPARLWGALTTRLTREDEPWEAEVEIVPLDLVDAVIGPGGRVTAAEVARRADCPVAPELLKEVR